MQGDSVDDLGKRRRAARVDRGAAGFGVDAKRGADHDGPQIKGADPSGCDRDGAELGAVVGARHVEATGGPAENAADPSADHGVADLRGWRTGGIGFLSCRRQRAGGFDRRIGAEGNPSQLGGEAAGVMGCEVGDFSFAVAAAYLLK